MMDILISVTGLAIGSFLNVVIYRLPRGMSLWYPPSTCPSCQNRLAFYDIIPLLSYVFLKGKCRKCKTPIGWRYPLTEVLTGVLFYVVYKSVSMESPLILYLVFTAFMVSIAIIDIRTQMIYNKMLLSLLIVGIVFNVVNSFIPWDKALMGMVSGGGAMWVIAWLGERAFKKESLGMGDVKFAAVAGFYLGAGPVLLASYLSFVGAFAAIVFMKLWAHHVPERLPLGPFLATGFLVILLWGGDLLEVYLSWVQ